MKILVVLLLSFSFALSIKAQQTPEQTKPAVEEPQYLNQVYYLDANGKLALLEKQTPKLKNKMIAMGYGGGSASYEIKGGKSSVRFKTGDTIEIITLAPSAAMSVMGQYMLLPLKVDKDKRELALMKTGAMGAGMKQNDLSEESIPVNVSPYGTASLKITPAQNLRPGEYTLKTRIGQDFYCFGVDVAPIADPPK